MQYFLLFVLCCHLSVPVQVIAWKDSSPKWPIMCWTGRKTLLTHPLGLASCCRSSAVAWTDRHCYAPVRVCNLWGGIVVKNRTDKMNHHMRFHEQSELLQKVLLQRKGWKRCHNLLIPCSAIEELTAAAVAFMYMMSNFHAVQYFLSSLW